MAISKPKKPQTTLTATTTAASSSAEDLDRLKSEVASFASSLGLAPLSSAAAGFDDSDFRKPVPVKAPKTLAPDPGEPKKGDDRYLKPKQKPKPHPLQIDPFDHEDKKRLPTYPLMKASSLSGSGTPTRRRWRIGFWGRK
uniref:Uncharacterized protein n=1 Tax=Ananas comosus var. bracteatus TaxID=296719 RepID=A0A6V7Q5J4_ANACO|nr:unnamed protein product [Ananas comosus var. bracteatus]